MTATQPKIRVLICNKYALFRMGIRALLREQSQFQIVGEASTAKSAIRQVERLRPDIVLMGEATPSSDSAEATRRIRAIDPDIKVLILSLNDDRALISHCLAAGASGYIRRTDNSLQLQSAIDAAYAKGNHGRLRTFVA
jgi:DNA-binding NarL/FixJ family response regulator